MANRMGRKRAREVRRILLILLFLLIAIITVLITMVAPYLESKEQEKFLAVYVDEFHDYVSAMQTLPPITAPAETTLDTQPTEQTAAPETEETIPLLFPELYAAMQAHNEQMTEETQKKEIRTQADYMETVIDLKDYGIENEIAGVISIPAINVEMAMYLGSSYDNLAKGFAQMSHTSMPIGGENTNCVLTVHRGWHGAPYMRDVDQLKLGDMVYLENFWGVLEYQIVEMYIIEPSNTKCVFLQPGRELLTIITCHPYGVGSHRYVVVCERVNTPDQTSTEPTPISLQ